VFRRNTTRARSWRQDWQDVLVKITDCCGRLRPYGEWPKEEDEGTATTHISNRRQKTAQHCRDEHAVVGFALHKVEGNRICSLFVVTGGRSTLEGGPGKRRKERKNRFKGQDLSDANLKRGDVKSVYEDAFQGRKGKKIRKENDRGGGG